MEIIYASVASGPCLELFYTRGFWNCSFSVDPGPWTSQITNQPAWVDWHRRRVAVGDSQKVLYRSKVATTLRGYLHFLFECMWSMLDLSWTKIWLLPAKKFGKLQQPLLQVVADDVPDLTSTVYLLKSKQTSTQNFQPGPCCCCSIQHRSRSSLGSTGAHRNRRGPSAKNWS